MSKPKSHNQIMNDFNKNVLKEPEFHFKFRAEIYIDAIHLMSYILKEIIDNNDGTRIYDFKMDGENVEFKSNRGYKRMLDYFLEASDTVPDIHYCFQSLQYAEDYSGERNMDITYPTSTCCKKCSKK